eukprot:963994-Rhodomonas_salina.2
MAVLRGIVDTMKPASFSLKTRIAFSILPMRLFASRQQYRSVGSDRQAAMSYPEGAETWVVKT